MLRLIYACSVLLLAVAFAVLPLDRQSVEYHWELAENGPGSPLVLIERSPDEFTLEAPCDAAEGRDGVLFSSTRDVESSSALLVIHDSGQIVVEGDDPSRDGRKRLALDVDLRDGCVVNVVHDVGDQVLVLSAGGVSVDGELSFQLTGFHWFGDDGDVRASVVTTPMSATRNSTLQRFVLLTILAAALVGISAALKTRWSTLTRIRGVRIFWSEGVILAAAVSVLVIDLPRVDDGRILGRARLISGLGLFTNVSTNYENRPLPQRWLYEWLLGTTVGWSSNILVLRLLPLLIAVIAWSMLRRCILPALAGGDPSRATVVASAAVHLLFVAAWLATLRPEPFILVLVVAVLAVVATWAREVNAWRYAFVVGAIGVGLATHAVGFAVVFAAVPVLWWLGRDLRNDWVEVATGVAWGGAVAVVVAFLGSNLTQTYQGLTRFRDDVDHSLGPMDFMNYVEQAVGGTSTMRAAVALTGVAIAVLTAEMLRRESWRSLNRRFAVVLGAGLVPLAFLLTPSKWLWHLTVLGPVAVVGWACLAEWLRERPQVVVAQLVMIAAYVGFVTAWALEPAWRSRTLGAWSDVTLRQVSRDAWSSRLPWLVGPDVRWWLWVIIMIAVGVFAYLVRRRSVGQDRQPQATPGGLALVLAVSAAVVSVVQLSPPVVDALVSAPQWTFVRQSAVGLVSAEAACGVPAETPEVRAFAASLDAQPDGDAELRFAGNSRVHLLAPCYRLIGQRDGVWQVPDVVFGEPQAGQRRLLVEYDLERVGCNDFPMSRSADLLCFSRLKAAGELQRLEPTTSSWRLSY